MSRSTPQSFAPPAIITVFIITVLLSGVSHASFTDTGSQVDPFNKQFITVLDHSVVQTGGNNSYDPNVGTIYNIFGAHNVDVENNQQTMTFKDTANAPYFVKFHVNSATPQLIAGIDFYSCVDIAPTAGSRGVSALSFFLNGHQLYLTGPDGGIGIIHRGLSLNPTDINSQKNHYMFDAPITITSSDILKAVFTPNSPVGSRFSPGSRIEELDAIPATVPEPASLVLLGLGGVASLWMVRRLRRASGF